MVEPAPEIRAAISVANTYQGQFAGVFTRSVSDSSFRKRLLRSGFRIIHYLRNLLFPIGKDLRFFNTASALTWPDMVKH
jgi:hypothetical protein